MHVSYAVPRIQDGQKREATLSDSSKLQNFRTDVYDFGTME